MANFLQFDSANEPGMSVFVRPDAVLAIEVLDDGCSTIVTAGGGISVAGLPADVRARLDAWAATTPSDRR